ILSVTPPDPVHVGAGQLSTASFTLKLTGTISQPVTVHYATAPGSAVEGTDYFATEGDLTFWPLMMMQTQTVMVPGFGSPTGGQNKDFYLLLSGLENADFAPGATFARAVIVDTAPMPQASVDPASVTVNDGGTGQLNFTVHLDQASGQDVTLWYQT